MFQARGEERKGEKKERKKEKGRKKRKIGVQPESVSGWYRKLREREERKRDRDRHLGEVQLLGLPQLRGNRYQMGYMLEREAETETVPEGVAKSQVFEGWSDEMVNGKCANRAGLDVMFLDDEAKVPDN
ncbi:hypothetical protein BS47DRAFT_1369513 [Hydnum rufescens UP504]|uniref:Uncharacterized protein n=1 Tax=Hydnum rufescens UP504 TaxID=1448309 RepID=A0A9P6DME4_9AGAM|nr:hypothetical protein BS47DRAFT_1369513 [Hydnum rufescens UP504]